MTTFERWFANQKPTEIEKQMLPLGVYELHSKPGKYFADCCSCGESYELPVDPTEDGFDPDMSYCGRSPRCCP